MLNFVSLVFSALGWKSKGFKSKGHSKSKGLKALKGTKAKSYIHKGLTKRSTEPMGHYLKGDSDSFKGHFLKGKCLSLKGKCTVYVSLIKILSYVKSIATYAPQKVDIHS
jgi:hypothetical protein